MLQQTSLIAFKEEIIPTLSERHQQVISALKRLGMASNMMLAQQLGWSINRVTPRIFELRFMNDPPIVVSAGNHPCKVTKRKVMYWRCNDEQR